MNQNDLYIEYARIIKMCKGTALESTPWLGVKFDKQFCVCLECFMLFIAGHSWRNKHSCAAKCYSIQIG